MAEREPIDSYQEAVAHFNELAEQPYSASEYLSRLTDIQSIGFAAGIEQANLFSDLERFSGVARQRATEIPNDEAMKRFTAMEQGYRVAFERVTQTQSSPPTPRSKTGVAAG